MARHKNIWSRRFIKVLLAGLALVCIISWFMASSRNSYFSFSRAYSWVLITPDNGLLLISHQGADSRGSVMLIQPETPMAAAYSLGQYPAKNLYQLGEQHISGGRLVKKTIQENLQIPVDSYLYTDNLSLADFNKLSGPIRQALVGSFIDQATDLSYFDRFKLMWFFVSHRLGEWDSFDLNDYLANNNNNFTPDFNRLDKILLTAFADREAIKDDITVGVINNSDCPQAAAKTIAFFEHFGVYAIVINNKRGDQSNSKLLISDRKYLNKKYIGRLRRLFDLSLSTDTDSYRQVDMVLVIGHDYCHLPD